MSNKSRTPIRLTLFFLVLIFSCILSLMAFAYDGGLWCAFAPKKCPLNRVLKPVTTPVQVIEKKEVVPTATLPPTPTQFTPMTPTSTTDPEITPTVVILFEPERQRNKIECGRNPYRYNYMEDGWERPFEDLCYVATDDPFDIVFGGDDWALGLNYDQVITILGFLDADSNSKEAQVQKLIEYGLWDYSCACVPDGSDFNVVVQKILADPTPTPNVPEQEDKSIEGD